MDITTTSRKSKRAYAHSPKHRSQDVNRDRHHRRRPRYDSHTFDAGLARRLAKVNDEIREYYNSPSDFIADIL